MPTEELKFEDLLKEYIDVIESTDVSKLKEENKVIKVDIERKGKEEKDIDARMEQIQSELDSLNENSTVKLEYPEAIKDKEAKLKEAKDFKENKEKEIKDLKDKTKENNKQIRKVNNIGKDVIKRAEERTNTKNEEIQKKIDELKIRKEKYGIKTKDKDGKETIQLTKEEKAVVDSIDNDVKKLKKEIRDNKKAFLLFKKDIEDAKKDKEAYLALKGKVKEKEEPKKEAPKKEETKKEAKQDDKKEQKTEDQKEEPKKTYNTTEVKNIPVTPRVKTSTKVANNTVPKATAKVEAKKEDTVKKPIEKTEEKIEDNKKIVSEEKQPQKETDEVKDPVLEKYRSEGFGQNAFGWYYNPWIDEYDKDYDPHNDKSYNEKLNTPELSKEEKTTDAKEEYEDISSNSKYKITELLVLPMDDKISFDYEDNGNIEKGSIENLYYTNEVFEDEAIEYILENSQQNMPEYYLEKFKKKFDPNIMALLYKTKNFNMLDDYIKGIIEKKPLPFELNYDLNNIEETDLSREELRNLKRIARAANKTKPKESFFDKIKSIFNKDKVKQLGDGIKEEIDLAKNQKVGLGNSLKIFGAKTYGKLIGRDDNITNFKISQIRNNSKKAKEEKAEKKDVKEKDSFRESLKVSSEKEPKIDPNEPIEETIRRNIAPLLNKGIFADVDKDTTDKEPGDN